MRILSYQRVEGRHVYHIGREVHEAMIRSVRIYPQGAKRAKYYEVHSFIDTAWCRAEGGYQPVASLQFYIRYAVHGAWIHVMLSELIEKRVRIELVE